MISDEMATVYEAANADHTKSVSLKYIKAAFSLVALEQAAKRLEECNCGYFRNGIFYIKL